MKEERRRYLFPAPPDKPCIRRSHHIVRETGRKGVYWTLACRDCGAELQIGCHPADMLPEALT